MLTIEKVIAIKAVGFFATLPHRVLASVAEHMDNLDVATGSAIINAGEFGRTLYVVVDGRVRIHRGGTTLGVGGPGDVFGEISALDPEPRTATVTAEQPTRLLTLDHEVLIELMSEHVEVARGIVRFLCHRFRERLD